MKVLHMRHTRRLITGFYTFVIAGFILGIGGFLSPDVVYACGGDGCDHGVGSPDTECQNFGFAYGVAKWEWDDGQEAYVPEGDPDGTDVTGTDEEASWTADPAVDGIVWKAGWEFTVEAGGTSGTIVKDDHDISHITFCNNEEPVPVCGNGTLEESEECDDGNNTNEDGCSAQCTIEETTLAASKVMCDDEVYLPNWGEVGIPDITPTTALDYVAQSNGHCWLEPDWTFQWGFGDKEGTEGVDKLPGNHLGEADGTDTTGMCPEPYCGPNTWTGTGYEDWKTFGPTDSNGTAAVTITSLESAPRLWVRENLKEGHLPFSYPPDDPQENNVTAELYCHTDTLNYDNYDFIANPVSDETYYCVAFNTPLEEEQPYCGNGIKEGSEECDDGNNTNEDGCSAQCTIEDDGGEPPQPYCGNGIREGAEACDGTAGVGQHQQCSQTCTLINLTYCGDTIKQSPNDEGSSGPQNDGYEACDGSDGVGSNETCTSQCTIETTDEQEPGPGGGPTAAATSGGGGRGGGGGFVALSVFNEKNEYVRIPEAGISWFSNLNATCRALYDTSPHDGTAPGPNYGYAFSLNETSPGGTFHTATLTGLQSGITYYWRPVCTTSSQTARGAELTIAAFGESPRVLGFTTEEGAAEPAGQPPQGEEGVQVLGFEKLPETGGDLTQYYMFVTLFFAGIFPILLRKSFTYH